MTMMTTVIANTATKNVLTAATHHVDQKVYAKNDYEIYDENQDPSRHNDNTNDLACDNNVENINDSLFGLSG